MNRFSITLALAACSAFCCAATEPSVTPIPMRVEMSAEDAGFTIDSLTRVYIDAPDRDAALLEEQLAAAGMGHALRVCDSVDAPRINFRLKPVVDGISSHEAAFQA